MASATKAKREKAEPEPDFFPLIPWAASNSIGENKAYEYCRRENDPMPHIKQGDRILVEPWAASGWIRRTFGIGY